MRKKIMKSIMLLCTCLLMLAQCKNQSSGGDVSANSTGDASTKSFGAAIKTEGSVPVEKVVAMLNSEDSIPMKVIGKVTSVCQARGCWMNVVDESGTGKPIFVQFKDYGFFMPKDCAGKKVTLEGIAYRQVTPVEELRH
ncbi:MAG: DUF4920 domain-containing protein, partial [Saprospiraceae bacterium]